MISLHVSQPYDCQLEKEKLYCIVPWTHISGHSHTHKLSKENKRVGMDMGWVWVGVSNVTNNIFADWQFCIILLI